MDEDALYAAAIAGDADAIAKLEMQADKLNEDDETILHLESKKGNAERVRFILRQFANKNLLVKLDYNEKVTALTWAAYYGHTEVAEVLIDAARHLPPPSDDDNPVTSNDDNTPENPVAPSDDETTHDDPLTSFQAFLRLGAVTALEVAVLNYKVAIVKLLVEADPSNTHTQNSEGKTQMYIATERGYTDIVKLICTTCTALSNLDGPRGTSTALHAASKNLDHGVEMVKVLIKAARLLSSSSKDKDNTHSQFSSFQDFLKKGNADLNTALHIAIMEGNFATAKLLVDQAYLSDTLHLQNEKGETPIYIAAEKGYYDIVEMICRYCRAPSNLDGPGGTTALHAAIKNLPQAKKEDRDVIPMIINAVKSDDHSNYTNTNLVELFNKTDENRCTILELAVEQNDADIVKLVLAENPAYRNNSEFIGLMPLIYKATDKGYEDIVRLLTEKYESGGRSSSSHGGGVAGIISAIRSRDQEAVVTRMSSTNGLAIFADGLGWTPLHHAAYHQFDAVIRVIIQSQTIYDQEFVFEDMVPTPFLIAAEKGYTSTVKLLMQFWPFSFSACSVVDKKGQNMLHMAALQSKKDMIKGFLKYCPEGYKNEIVNKVDKNGNTPLHILIGRGCFVPELMKYKKLDLKKKNKEGCTPRDMLYSQSQIIEDQVQIKIALDEIQRNQEDDILSSSVLPSTREEKDELFKIQAKVMMEKDLERYKSSHSIDHWLPDAIAGNGSARAALEMKAYIVNEEKLETILHVAATKGDIESVQFILWEFANKNLLGKLNKFKQTALHLAVHHEHTEVVKVLIDAAERNYYSADAQSYSDDFIRQADDRTGNTALHLAVFNGNLAIVELLVRDDRHSPNHEGKTPIYMAAENGYDDIIQAICSRSLKFVSLDGPLGSTTALHTAILKIHKAKVKTVIERMMDTAEVYSQGLDPGFEAYFKRTNESGRTILELAVDRNCVELVELILAKDPAYQLVSGSKNGLMRLICDHTAIIHEEHKDILKLLTETYEAEVSDVHKGVIDLIVAIRRRKRDDVVSFLQKNEELVMFTDEDGWTVLHHAANHEFDAVLPDIIEAQKAVGHPFTYKKCNEDEKRDKSTPAAEKRDQLTPAAEKRYQSTPFHTAAEKRYTLTVIRLMELWPTSSSAFTDVDDDGRNILHLAALHGEKEMIEGILKQCPEEYKNEIMNKQDNDGNTPLHLLIKCGCYISELVKYKGLDTMTKNKEDKTPLDYIYEEDQIIADQVQIKIALDNIQTNKYWKFWRQKTESKLNYMKSIVLGSRRMAKDKLFEIAKKRLVDDKRVQKKINLERYKDRTTTQIIVTALITTVTFTVGFTMPGGLYQSGELNQGLVIFSKKKAFGAFMISDAIALLLSTCSLFLYFLQSMYDDPHKVSKLNSASTGLNIVSVIAMMLTFITGTYVVLSHSPALAIAVGIIGSLFFLFVIVLLVKLVYDGQEENEVTA